MDIEEVDHTARYIHKLHDLGGIEDIQGLSNLAAGLYAALHAEHDLVIRLSERLKMARIKIACLEEAIKDGDA